VDAPACDGDRRIGLGVIGAGQIVRERHVPGFKRIRGVELVGVVNRSPESSRRAQEAHGFQRTYGHWRELIDDAEVDAVLIATWPYLHAPITLAALDAGKHVLTQARMAMDGAEARAMLAASRAHPELVAMVVPSPFTLWVDRTIQRLLREQAVGEVRSVRVLWAPGTRDPEQRLHWRHQRELSGNNVMALGVAYEAMARWLGQAVAVQAMTHVFDPYKVAADGGRTVTSIPDHVALMAEFPGRSLPASRCPSMPPRSRPRSASSAPPARSECTSTRRRSSSRPDLMASSVSSSVPTRLGSGGPKKSSLPPSAARGRSI